MSRPVADPGWRPVIRLLPKMFVPFIGMRSMATQPSALISLRMMWLYLAVAMVPVWAVVGLVIADVDPTWPVGRASLGAAVVGLGLLGVNRLLAGRIRYGSVDAFIESFPRMTMVQFAVAGGSGLGGFVMTILSASAAPYAIGFAFAGIGLWLAAPAAGRLAHAQRVADANGSSIDVVATLVKHRLSR